MEKTGEVKERRNMKRAALHNLGCKVNAYETEAMGQLLRKAGYEIVPFEEEADVYVVNTCTVTNVADKKSRQMLHRAKKRNPRGIVVAVGCYVQVAADVLAADPAVDLIIGNHEKSELAQILADFMEEREREEAREDDRWQQKVSQENDRSQQEEVQENDRRQQHEAMQENDRQQDAAQANDRPQQQETAQENDRQQEATQKNDRPRQQKPAQTAPSPKPPAAGKWSDISRVREYEPLSIDHTEEHTRAFMKIQDGCNQFCSYCIIPYARGRVRSRAPEEVEAEARTLVRAGYREIVLTGIHISSYGIDLPEERKESLIGLMERLDAIEGLDRMRLGSLEPRIVTEEFAERLSKLRTVCPHFHLSLQSGCDATLRRMNRHYTTEEYENGCRILRRYFDRPAITTDVITGFPGETEEEFVQTEAFLKKIGFYELHVFPYSRRAGTRAAAMTGQVEEAVKHARSARLLQLDAEMSLAYRKQFLGETREVLFEEKIVVDGKEYLVGHTKEYLKAAIPWDEAQKGRILRGRLEKMLNQELFLLWILSEKQ